MLYRHLNGKYSKHTYNNQSTNTNNDPSSQVLLLSKNKLFSLNDDEVKYINNNLDKQSSNCTLVKYKLNKSVLTKIIHNYRYNLRNRKKIKQKRHNRKGDFVSDSSFSLDQDNKNEDDTSSLHSKLSILSRKKNKKKNNNKNKRKQQSDTRKIAKEKILKDKYEKRFDKILTTCENNVDEDVENEFITSAQASAVFGEMFKALNRKQDKKQRKPLKEEEKIEKRQKIISFKQRIHSLSLVQIKELHAEFFKAVNDNDNDASINLNFEMLDMDQIEKFSTKLDWYENLNKLNKESHKTFREELMFIRQSKENNNQQSLKPGNVKISGKDIPFLNEEDDDDLDISSSSSDNENNNIGNNSEMSLGNNDYDNNLPKINAMDKVNNAIYTKRKIIDDDEDISNEEDNDEGS